MTATAPTPAKSGASPAAAPPGASPTAATPGAGPEILPLGLDRVVVRFATRFSDPANLAALALARGLAADPLPGQLETAPALGSVLLRFDRRATSLAALEEALRQRLRHPPRPATAITPGTAPPRLWRVPACFGGASGPQLAETAALAGRSEAALVAELCATDLRVLALGFAPGQPYLGPLPAHWQMERLAQLTPRVAPGTIATALCQIVLFAAASPTGWRTLGRAALRPFVAQATKAVLLAPGDMLRFQRCSEADIAALEALDDPRGGAVAEPLPDPALP